MYQNSKGRIIEIDSVQHKGAYITQGITKDKQPQFDASSRYIGSGGTYLHDFEYYGTTLDVKVYVYDLEKCVTFDIRDYVLQANNKKRISSELLEYIIKNNKGEKVDLCYDDKNILFDYSRLKVVREAQNF